MNRPFQKMAAALKQISFDTSEYSAMWKKLLGVNKSTKLSEIYRRVFLSSVGNFNYWEQGGQIVWPSLGTEAWFEVIRGKRDILTMNLAQKRKELLDITNAFLQDSPPEKYITDKTWWKTLNPVFGGDPLHKRETLAWIILDDMRLPSIVLPPVDGCIDYNVIVALRYNGLLPEFTGNRFNLYDETRLRFACLDVIKNLRFWNRSMSVSMLDKYLFDLGRHIRKHFSMWEDYFCYRIGCFYY